MGKREVIRVGKVFNVEIFFSLGNTAFCQRGNLALFVNNIVRALFLCNFFKVHFGIRFGNTQAVETFYKVICKSIKLRGLAAHSGNDERSSRFINKD